MAINEVYYQVRDYRKILVDSNAFTSGRMGHSAAEFYKYLRTLIDFLLIPNNINAGFLIFLANPENIESLGPIIELIQPSEERNEVRYRIAVALTAEIDRLVEKEKKYVQLGINDKEALTSFRMLEKYFEKYNSTN